VHIQNALTNLESMGFLIDNVGPWMDESGIPSGAPVDPKFAFCLVHVAVAVNGKGNGDTVTALESVARALFDSVFTESPGCLLVSSAWEQQSSSGSFDSFFGTRMPDFRIGVNNDNREFAISALLLASSSTNRALFLRNRFSLSPLSHASLLLPETDADARIIECPLGL
jgi:hypothetical protein